ncbi:MAG: hypothetical protein JNL01_10050 [Bdellovibrionales bacterium]|nr:hypothetical protein [Bdellovibrionales bacterium]
MSKHFILTYLPLLLTNVLHMWMVKWDWLSPLKIPVNERLFGKNKTWRGIFLVAILNLLFFSAVALAFGYWNELSPEAPVLGLSLGLAYSLSELPNSFLKRRLGIAPGQKSGPGLSWSVFSDRADSALGVCWVYCWMMNLDVTTGAILFFPALLVHLFFSAVLVALKVKEQI